jgi:hypothetical protein
MRVPLPGGRAGCLVLLWVRASALRRLGIEPPEQRQLGRARRVS